MSKCSCIKGILRIMAAVVTLSGISSCDNREKVVGHWQSGPEAVCIADSVADAVTTCLVISGDGRVLLTSDITVTRPETDTTNIFVDSVTVRAVASIEGQWSYVSHKNDEISITLDRSTFGVSIDPDDVSYTPAPINRRVSLVHDSMKDATIDEYRQKLSPGLESHFDEFVHIEGISVGNGVMHCRSARNSYTMTAL